MGRQFLRRLLPPSYRKFLGSQREGRQQALVTSLPIGFLALLQLPSIINASVLSRRFAESDPWENGAQPRNSNQLGKDDKVNKDINNSSNVDDILRRANSGASMQDCVGQGLLLAPFVTTPPLCQSKLLKYGCLIDVRVLHTSAVSDLDIWVWGHLSFTRVLTQTHGKLWNPGLSIIMCCHMLVRVHVNTTACKTYSSNPQLQGVERTCM